MAEDIPARSGVRKKLVVKYTGAAQTQAKYRWVQVPRMATTRHGEAIKAIGGEMSTWVRGNEYACAVSLRKMQTMSALLALRVPRNPSRPESNVCLTVVLPSGIKCEIPHEIPCPESNVCLTVGCMICGENAKRSLKSRIFYTLEKFLVFVLSSVSLFLLPHLIKVFSLSHTACFLHASFSSLVSVLLPFFFMCARCLACSLSRARTEFLISDLFTSTTRQSFLLTHQLVEESTNKFSYVGLSFLLSTVRESFRFY